MKAPSLTFITLHLLFSINLVRALGGPSHFIPDNTHHIRCDAYLPANSAGAPDEIQAALDVTDMDNGFVSANDCLNLCSCTDKAARKCKDAPAIVDLPGLTDLACLKWGAPGHWKCWCEKNS